VLAQNFNAFTNFNDVRRPNENTRKILADIFNVEVGFKALYLAAIRVTAHHDIHHADVILFLPFDAPGKKNQPGACAKNRFVNAYKALQWLEHVVCVDQSAHCRAFAAW
jgi:hypothetical protein